MGSHPSLCHLIHTSCTDLDFYEATFGPLYGNLEGFVAIGLGCGNPISQTLCIGREFVRNQTIAVPAGFVLLPRRGFYNDAQGGKVEDIIERNPLLLHFVVDGANALSAGFYLVAPSLGTTINALPKEGNKLLQVFFACSFGLSQHRFDGIERFGLRVF